MLTPEQFDALGKVISAMIAQAMTGANPSQAIEQARALLVEQPAKEMPTIERRCTSKKSSEGSGSPQIPCDGHVIAGQVYGGCGEPCRWNMQKIGEGYPPW